MSQGYFVIRMNDDGEASVDGPLSSEALKERITPDADGETYYGRKPGFADSVPRDLNDIAGEKILIIKGEVVVPRPAQRVVEYDLP